MINQSVNAVERLQHLINEIGSGELTAKCIVDQPYAQIQHEDVTYHHVHGGRAKYLEGPLYENYPIILQIMTDALFDREGSHIEIGMIEIAEKMSSWVEENAPRRDGELVGSGHPIVYDNGVVIYDRAPIVPRSGN